MARTDGEQTKKKILQVAEQLFSEKGFKGTSVAEIADGAKVNKALIYYHFKNKEDIVLSLFSRILEELCQYLDQVFGAGDHDRPDLHIREKIQGELQFLARRKDIVSVMLMESLKSGDTSSFLFRCAELVFRFDPGRLLRATEGAAEEDHRYLVREFFTGFIPMFTFVAYRDKWCDYFKCDSEKLLDYFMDAFERSHLALHTEMSSSGE